ncbi:cellular tumor antigen p53-like [Pieris brassicae]|uniref:p53 DNA-binding domain-containing protein n=1 Tax=Pieris brassicae TaxID=7116 RepID=A0A9P0TDV5_PIEBR|nr:cellular tumor antigen p53-like [Pieris brassicae]XP_045517737.1 cellular tumor antigen p53-like [Pieris brassicae]XP_045517738.1 cellular tumor antigen p53-like [Pieris brassicae]CAH4028024.1 unnamed protein product [Pieris brassicae]
MFKCEFPDEGVVPPNFDEGVDSDVLSNYLRELDGFTGSQIEICHEAPMDVPLVHHNNLIQLVNPVDTNRVPTSPQGPPARTNLEGIFKFKAEIDSKHTKRKKYLYSHRLNRIYVDVNVNFSVGFTWDASIFPGEAYIRATTVFSDVTQAEKRVERCYQHSHETANAPGKSRATIMNVLHSAREHGSPDVHYCGNPEQPDSWYSVLVRTPQPTELAYVFLCKSSCSSGINRRPIEIIFTLEDFKGEIYGRQVVGARVCSCPRRDIDRDEVAEGLPKTKRSAPQQETRAKKVKVETVEKDDAVIKLPAIGVVGRRTAILGLEVMLNMMEQKRDGLIANRLSTDTTSVIYNLDKSIANLIKHINQLKGQQQ